MIEKGSQGQRKSKGETRESRRPRNQSKEAFQKQGCGHPCLVLLRDGGR